MRRVGSADREQGDGQGALANDWPELLIDLARLEWAIYEVFDGPGVEGQPLLGFDQLSSIPPDRWGEVALYAGCCFSSATPFR